jgi:hypothetical protein
MLGVDCVILGYVRLRVASKMSAVTAKIFWSDSRINGNKHGQSLRGPRDRCLAIFNFTVLLKNPTFAASNIAARDLISSYFRFPWRVGLRDFWTFVRPCVPCEQLPIVPRPSATLYPTWWRGYSVGYKGEYLVNRGIPVS